MIPSDFLPRGGVHIHKRQLSPDGMLSDLIPFPHEDELEVPVILRAIHLREHERAFEGRRRQAELFFQDPLGGGLGRLADHQVRGGEHPSLAVRLGPLRIEGSHVVPRGRGVEVPHQDVFRVSRLADHEECRKAESTFRDLMRGHRSSHGVESTELPLGGHVPRKFAGLFQPSCLGQDQ